MPVRTIRVFGNVNDDITFHRGEPCHFGGIVGPNSAIDIIGSELSVGEGCFLTVPYEGKRMVFKIKPGNYRDKCDVESPLILPRDDVKLIAGHFNVSVQDVRLSKAQSGWPLPGGGANNVGRGLYHVFKGLSRQLVATCSEGQKEGFHEKLAGVWGGEENVTLCPLEMPVLVNIVFERLGTHFERCILRGNQDRDVPLTIPWQSVDYVDGPVTCMVNTVYNRRCAVYSLVEAMNASSMVIACTESLCDKKPMPDTVGKELADFAKSRLDLPNPGRFSQIHSVHRFLKEIVLPHKKEKEIPPIWIFNESEFGNFLDMPIWIIKDGMRDQINAQRIFEGLQRFRDWENHGEPSQSGKNSVVFVTCGKMGAFALDSNDGLHFCDTLELNTAVQEKNAIGDLFASGVLGLVSGGICEKAQKLSVPHKPNTRGSSLFPIKEEQLWVAYALLAASAEADSGVYEGFRNVSVASVNSFLPQKGENHNYAYFGGIGNIINALRKEQDIGLTLFRKDRMPGIPKDVLTTGDMPQLMNLVEPKIL